jgi:hypothetical protein
MARTWTKKQREASERRSRRIAAEKKAQTERQVLASELDLLSFEQAAIEANQLDVAFDDSPLGKFDVDIQPAPRMSYAVKEIVQRHVARQSAQSQQLSLPIFAASHRESREHWWNL